MGREGSASAEARRAWENEVTKHMSRPKRLQQAPTVEQLQCELDRVRRLKRFRQAVRRTVAALALIAAAAAALAVLTPVMRVHGTSMDPTLQEGDVLVAVRGLSCEAGDIAAFSVDDMVLVKRIVAGAGDVVDIQEDGAVVVNGQKRSESYVREQDPGTLDIELPCRVPDNSWFVLGDHRAVSIDSRNSAVGCLSQEQLIGKIVFRIWPLDRLGWLTGNTDVGE